jgi:hypothetical protein
MEGGPKILYIQSSGVGEPRRCATPFFLATAAATMDVEVGIYFTVDGATLLRKDVPESLIVPKAQGEGRPLSDYVRQAKEAGVKFYVCQPALELHGLTLEDLIDGVEMIGGVAFNFMAMQADAVIAF